MNILIFPADSEIGREVFESLKNNKEYTLIAGTSNEKPKSEFLGYDNILRIPHISSNGFTKKLSHILEIYSIDLVFPCHDDVSLELSKNLLSHTITHNSKINEVCRYKRNTYDYLKGFRFIPIMYPENFPKFIKPNNGSGSKNTEVVFNEKELLSYTEKHINIDFVVTEYLPGKEYTVDCLSINGDLLFTGARIRESTKNGISDLGKEIKSPEIDLIAETINCKFKELGGFNGAWFFQVKEDINGVLKLLEIGPRVSGGMGLYRMKGINFSELSILTKLGVNNLRVKDNKLTDLEFCKFFIPKYKYKQINYSHMYIDFDDTLYLHKKDTINTTLIKLIFQAIAEGKRVYLITRSKYPFLDILKKYKLDTIWDSIIHLTDKYNKSEFIKDYSVLIDDSFSERNFDRKNVWCFDIHNFELLINN